MVWGVAMLKPSFVKAPEMARDSCFGCTAHDHTARLAHENSCALGRPQARWWTAAENLRIRPVSHVCTDQALIDLIGECREMPFHEFITSCSDYVQESIRHETR